MERQNENTDNQDNEIPNKSSDPNETQEKISGQNSDFIILGVKNKRREREVKRTLPEWLANPEVISIDLNSGPTLDDMNSILDSKLIEALRANGINKLFPVQASMVSWLSKCNKDRQQKWWLRDTLVCSDAIARGIDIRNVQLVISYDLPKHINGYIQRTGRTGHAGKCGTAISILTPKQVKIFKHMLNNAHKVIPRVEKIELSGIINDIDYLSHIDKLKHALEIEKQNLLRAEAIK
ncbi:probable ATP-dependent RNA helicase Dbp73D [Bombus fervidus]|uniref:probable ATP-dependent RNA helicase Dbp73D n=1 Tax=Bombus fervidus TaxID=203811 RepID=UPI003AB8C4F3